jgi:hypothetical protein
VFSAGDIEPSRTLPASAVLSAGDIDPKRTLLAATRDRVEMDSDMVITFQFK